MTEFSRTPLGDDDALLRDWSALYARADHQSFFLSPAWMRAWLGGRKRGDAVSVLTGAEDGAIIILALATDASRRPPVVGFAEAWLHEFGERARDAVYIEYNDFLVAADAPDSARKDGAAALLDQSAHADGVVVRNARAPLFTAFSQAAAEKGLDLRILREQPVRVAALADGAMKSETSASLRARLRKTMNAYEERGAVVSDLITPGPGFDETWAELETLHEARWSARGQAGAFANPHLVAFHKRLRDIAPDSVHLFRVRAGEQTVGVLYNFLWNGRAMNYQSGFLFEGDAKLAPGYLTHAMAAEHYRAQGVADYDFLAGDDDYKARLGETESVLTSFVVERPGWRRTLKRLVRR